MPVRFSFGKRLARVAVHAGFLLGFVGCLIAGEIRASYPVRTNPAALNDAATLDVWMAVSANLPDEADLAVEAHKSIELFRVDGVQSAFPVSNPEIKTKTASEILGSGVFSISSPLLE